MSDNDKPGLSYHQAGVDIDAGNDLVERIKPYVKRTLRPEVMAGLGGFGGLFALGERFQDPVLVSGTDGVGTKLLLARQLGRHDTIGIDLVAMCVNDVLVQAAEPLFFLDYFACGKLDLDQAEAVIRGIAEGCHRAGCALIGGETAEMPGMYAPGEYDLAGFAVGAVERGRLVDGRRIRPGCRLLGLASSGPHSNGYSLIRRVLEISGESPDRAFDGTTLGETLLAPTRIYAEPVRRILNAHLPAGMAHITGGGLTDNIIRVVPEDCGIAINSGAWQVPEIFGWLQQTGNIADAEMRRTFNLGIGYVIIVESDAVAAVRDAIDEPLLDMGEVTTIQPGGERVRFIDP